MRDSERIIAAVTFTLVFFSAAAAQNRRPIAFDDLISMNRVSDPKISPDGKWVAYTVATPDKAENRTDRNLWLAAAAGGQTRQLTRSGRDGSARWSPGGSEIAFISDRDGSPQVYIIPFGGGEAARLTDISTGVEWLAWSPDGKMIAFTSRVYPDCADDACNVRRDSESQKSKVKARLYDNLLYRHWTEWWDYKRSHLFVIPAGGGLIRDLTPKWEFDVPPVQRGGSEAIAWSPDSKELCFTSVAEKMEATSTNSDLFTVPAAGGQIRRITTNPAFDTDPSYSPDGTLIAYRAQLHAGNEADRYRIFVFDRSRGTHGNLTEDFDRSVDSMAWSPDGKQIYFNAEDRAQMPVFVMAAGPGSKPIALTGQTYNGEFDLSPDGKLLVFSRQSNAMPVELVAAANDGKGEKQITNQNTAKLEQLDLPRAEHFWFDSADGAKVHGMLLRPPAFDPGRKYPLLMVAHGGPETQFGDAWSYRWNTQLFASPGYVVLMINRRGSTGFGQRFTDEVRDDWGGRAFGDLMKGLDFAVANYPFIDGSRVAASGGSYGGFMTMWMESQSKGRFKAIISHAGVYNQESMYGSTEELWFPEWEFRGVPWTNRAVYEKWSPKTYASDFGKYKTPTLVIAGELDFRVPYTQSLEFFTALQRQGVPSKLLIFPDEGHWINKPQNSELWYKTFWEWLAAYLK
jgi:dipeptidyl aminopeptidase/acylaminoacyl peptidase